MARPRPVALRYMTEFRCLGAQCEDHCCGGWTIAVDQGHFVKIRRALEREPGGATRFAAAFLPRPPAEREPEHFAAIEMRADGTCPMVDGQGLCDLQRRHGEALLPDACAMYPRALTEVAERLELSGALSCPEVARRALLHEGATDFLPAPAASLGRAIPRRGAPGSASDARAIDGFRHAAARILDLREHPLRSRLFVLAFLAHRAAHGEDASPLDLAPVMADVDRMGLAAVAAGLHQRLGDGDANLPQGLAVLGAVLGRRLDPGRRSGFHRVVGAVLESYANAGVTLSPGSGGVQDLDFEPALLASSYQRRRRDTAALAPRLDLLLERYCRHGLTRDRFLDGPSLWHYAQGMLLRVALLRFLIIGHPAVASGRDQALDAAAVEVCYAFSRVADHNTRFTESLDRLLSEELTGLPHSVCLLSI